MSVEHTADEPTRRSVLRGAALGGALVWAAPTVQVLTPPAFATGSVAPTLSYVGLLLRRRTSTGTTFYRVKYEFHTHVESASTIVVEGGPTWETGGCSDPRTPTRPAFYRNGAGLTLGGTTKLSTDVPPETVVTKYDVFATDGGFYAVLAVGVEMLDWVMHKGKCCAYRASSVTAGSTCQAATPSGAYKVQFLQYINDGPRSGNQWLFPAAPNDSTCTKLGTKSFAPVSCLSSSMTGSPR